jgi:hypothetical protein
MILFPAIDLKNGQCVRLEQGDMTRATVFNLDPAAQAASFAAQGFEYLHVVDLDGAFAGKPMNAAAVESMLAAVSIPVQLGGGIRDLQTVEAWLSKGVARVIIGTAAVRDPELVKSCRSRLGRDLRGSRPRYRQAIRGCWRRSRRLHRYRARRPLERPQLGCHRCAGQTYFYPGDRLGRPCVDRRCEGAAGATCQEAGRRDRRPRAL